MEDGSSRVMALFLGELEDRIDTFDRDLVSIEAQSSDSERAETIRDLFRAAHSLKGAAATVGAAGIEAVCHRLEDLLAELRERRVTLDAPLIDVLFEATKALRSAGRDLARGEDAGPTLGPLMSRLEAAMTRGGLSTPGDSNPPPAPFAESYRQAREDTVRVSAAKLDELLRENGEVLFAAHRSEARHGEILALREAVRKLRLRSRGQDVYRAVDRLASAIAADGALLERAARRLDAEVRGVRMLPFATACEGLDRIVRDTVRAAGKKAQLRINGANVEVDRSILEGLRDALVHLVRNAVDHGIERAEHRAAAGKPHEGTVTVTAALHGAGVEVSVADDGAGLDTAAIRQRARERNLAVDDDAIERAVFLPGVSTARAVTSLSGRGVGLDAVREAVDRLRGTIRVSSKRGHGTRFVLSLPLTLTTLRVILFGAAGRAFAMDMAAVDRVARIDREHIAFVEGRAMVTYAGVTMPLVPFEAVLGLPIRPFAADAAPISVVIVSAHEDAVALQAGVLLEEREVVVRSLGPRLAAAPAVAGATVLADGSIALIARTAFLLERAVELARTFRVPALAQAATPPKRVLLVEDSITTRTLERSILEAEGYDVTTAGDGEEAWRVLEGTDVDLVIADVEMPRMDGFGLTEAIRASERLRDLPVVLVTARGNDADKRRGIEAGADAYIVKGSFDQREFLEKIGQLC